MNSRDKILPDNIKDLLLKYYEGKTSIDDEKLLKGYFAEHDIPSSMLADKALLSFRNQEEELALIPNNDLWERINQSRTPQIDIKRTIRIATSIAASLLIIFSIGLGFYFSASSKVELAKDTFTNPEDAYKAAQRYLGFASQKLSYAYTEIKPIEMLSLPGKALQPFSEINKSFDKLNELNRINTTTRKLEHISVFSNYFELNEKN